METYVAQQLRLKRQAFQQGQQTQYAQAQQRQAAYRASQVPMEARTYPDTNGKVSLTSLQKEIDDATI